MPAIRPDRPRAMTLALRLLAFGSGLSVLVLEIGGARLLAQSYGLSAIPWTAILTAVLGGLALGNTLGGRAADRRPGLLPWLYLGAALSALVPLLAPDLPARAADRAGFLPGALVTSTAFFFLPSFLMGAVSPFLVKADASRLDGVGRATGSIGAWATLGAIVGTLWTGFVLLPTFPIPWILAGCSVALLLFGALAFAVAARPRSARAIAATSALLLPLPVLLVALGFGRASTPEGATLVWRGQSLHASIAIYDREWTEGARVRELWQNGSRSSMEYLATGEPAHAYQVATAWLISDRIEALDSLLVLGGAANTFPTAVKRWEPRVGVTVVEVDPVAVRLAREYFAYGTLPEGALEMRVEDARVFLRRPGPRYDVVIADAYDHLYSVPWTLVTREAFEGMEARMREGGLLIATLTTPLQGPGARFLEAVAATALEVFPQVRLYPADPSIERDRTQEVLLVAARGEADLPAVDWPSEEAPAGGAILTDAHAPVEYLQAIRFRHDPAWR